MSELDSLVTIPSASDAFFDTPMDEDEESMTPAEMLNQMRIAWQNECASPCLLPHRFDLVECMVDQVEGMEENLTRLKQKIQLKMSIHRFELQRMTYLCNDYVRCRLKKIEENARGVLIESEQRRNQRKSELMSEMEISFAEKFAQAEGQLFMKLFLDKIPTAMAKVFPPEEDLECDRVFARVVENNVEDVTVPDYTDKTTEVIVSLEKDSIHLIPFLSIKDHLETGHIRIL